MSGLQDKIVQFAKSKVGTKVDNGQCFYLADYALKDAGAKSAADYKPVKEDDDYIWGDATDAKKTLAGDILQFRDFTIDVTHEKEFVIDFPQGEQINYYEMMPDAKVITYSPNHTAVATTAVQQGKVTVLEQNVDRGSGALEKIVRARDLYLTSQPKKTSKSTQRITIDSSWGTKVKKPLKDPAHKKFVDELVKKYKGKSFTANVTTTFQVQVSGKLWVYRAVKK